MPSLPSTHDDGTRWPRRAAVLAVLLLSLSAVATPASAAETRSAPDQGTAGAASDHAQSATAVRADATSRSTCLGRADGPSEPSADGTAIPTPNETEDRTVALGDVAAVPVTVPAGATVSASFRPADGDGDGYAAQFRIEDDGDGEVTLLVNTYLAANGSTVAPGTYGAVGTDTVTVTGDRTTAPLSVGNYTVRVERNGSVADERRVTVTEPSVESMTAFRAAPSLFEASSPEAVHAANESGLIQPLRPGESGPEAVAGETVLLRIDAPSLLGAVAARPGNTTTERFLALHDRTSPETPETFQIHGLCGGVLFAESAASGSARVIADYRTGALYVLLAAGDLEGIEAGRQSVFLEVFPGSPLHDSAGDDERELTTEFHVAEQRTTLRTDDGGVVRLAAEEQVPVRGETNLLPGSRVPVAVESRLGPSFERRTTATVTDDGTFTANLDLSTATDPGLFAVRAGDVQAPGRIGSPPLLSWDLRHVERTDAVEELVVENGTLSDGGFLVAYRYDADADRFRRIGVTVPARGVEWPIDPIEESRYVVIVAHRDGNGNAAFDGAATDPPYRVDGRIVHDWFPVTVDGSDLPREPPATTFAVDRIGASTGGPTERGTATADGTVTTGDGTVTSAGTDAPTTASPGTTPESTASTTVPAGSTTEGEHTEVGGSTTADGPGVGPVIALLVLVCVGVLVASLRR